MKRIPTVSVLIPCYNRANDIEKVIRSVQNQTHAVEEIIVVDDASTDQSISVIQKCGVKLICHEANQGPAIARNTAFSASSGEIVIFIDSDAIADQRMIENIMSVYENSTENERLGGVGGRGIEAFSEGIANQWRSLHARQDHGEVSKRDVAYLFGLCCSYPREVFSQVGGFDRFYPKNAGEDLDIGIRIHRAGYRLAYTPAAFIYHQHRDTLESLKRVQYNWTYWNFITQQRNKLPTLKIYFGLFRRFVDNSLYDLFVKHSLHLAIVNVTLLFVKIKAIIDARNQVNFPQKR
jgi:glycosyltransferase involved in cell wall biosynthesis